MTHLNLLSRSRSSLRTATSSSGGWQDENGDITHHEWLADGPADPRPELAERLTVESFAIDPDFSPGKFDESFGLMDDPAQTIRIRFAPKVADFLREREWHPTQTIEDLADGSVVLSMRAGGLDEIVSWILFWGDAPKVLEPPAPDRSGFRSPERGPETIRG